MPVVPVAAASMTAPPSVGIIIFGSAATADYWLAGLPAAARAVHAAARAGLGECRLEVAGGWHPDAMVRQEIFRLAGAMPVRLPPDGEDGDAKISGDSERHDVPSMASGTVLLISGEALAGASALDDKQLHAVLAGESAAHAPELIIADATDMAARRHLADETASHAAALAHAGRRIIAATAKPGDGIVSRYINRPISQAISRLLLRFARVRPIHATAGTALFGLSMLATLVLVPDRPGLIAGAILFQSASVFDGVDGEIARATFRTSERGALIDSLVDAATNLAFAAGVVVNLWRGGHREPALFGIAGLAMLALGLTIIGRRARVQGGPFSFDGVKQRVRASGSRVGLWLTWLTMRDFIALASVALVVAGLAIPALVGFSVIMALWLAVVLAAGVRQTA